MLTFESYQYEASINVIKQIINEKEILVMGIEKKKSELVNGENNENIEN